MSLTTPSKLRELQIKLYLKAKNEFPVQIAWHPTSAMKRCLGTRSLWLRDVQYNPRSRVCGEASRKAGNPHVRFDERGWETGPRFGVSAGAYPRLSNKRSWARPGFTHGEEPFA
jgi:hypothetical protein